MGGSPGRRGHPAAEVLDFKAERGTFPTEANFGAIAARVAMKVGERFLRDAKDAGLDFLREAAEILVAFKSNLNSATAGETVPKPF